MMMIKMAAVSTITLLLLCCLIASTDSQADCDQYAATGLNVIVNLNHKWDKAVKLRWKHDSTVIVDRRGDTFVTGTKDDISEDGSLKLTNLMKSKAGKYTPEIYNQEGHLIPNLQSTQLCILDSVKKPTVKISCPKSKPPVTVTLTCDVGQAENYTLKWFQNNKELEKQKNLILNLNAESVETDSFKCEVSNPVSNMTSDPVVQNCYKRKSFLYEELYGIQYWIIIAVGGGVVVLLMIIVIVCVITNRRKKHLQLKDEGELRLAWTNEQQQHQHPADQQHQQHHNHHHHHPHHHHQQQPAGHTGPRQHRSKQQRDQQRPRAPDHGHPLPSPRRAAQVPKPVDNVDDEQPPPLPQPRKKAPKTPKA